MRDFFEHAFMPYIEKGCRLATVRRYRSDWNLHLSRAVLRNVERQPLFADFPVADVRTPHVQLVLDDIVTHGAQRAAPKPRFDETGQELPVCPLEWQSLNANSIKCMRSTMTSMFSCAIRLGAHPGGKGGNPAREVSLKYNSVPKVRDEQPSYDLDTIDKLLAVLPETASVALAIAAFAGLRLGELEGLRWENLVMEQGIPVIRVEQSIFRGRVQPPKSAASKASVPIIAELQTRLDHHRERMGNPSTGYILSARPNKPVSLSNLVSRKILPVVNRCIECGKPETVPHIGHLYERDASLPEWHGWHGARRGLSTNVVALGASDLLASRMLRHSNVQVTRQSYIFTRLQERVKGMAVLQKELSERQNEASGLFGTLDDRVLTPPKSVN